MTGKIRFVYPQAKAPDTENASRRILILGQSSKTGRARAESFARAYADFISRLSAANASRDWWAFSLAGKSTLSSKLPERCFYLWLIVEEASAMAGGTLYVVSDDGVLAAQVGLWGRENGVAVAEPPLRSAGLKETLTSWTPLGPVTGFLRALWRRLQAQSLRRFNPDPGRSYAVFATWINRQSFDASGNYRDIFFGDLPGAIAARGGHPLIFGAIIEPYSANLGRLRRDHGGLPVIPMDYFVSWNDLWDCFLIAFYRRCHDFPLRVSARLNGIDAGFLIREDMRRNCRESRFFSDLWYQACAKALLRHVQVSTLYYPFENLSRERMLAMAFRAHSPQSRLVGYQHAALTPAHLNFRLGKDEAEVLPLPDSIVTMGEVTRHFMIERGGFPEALLRAGCALRQRLCAPAPAGRKSAGDGRPRLLVALATSPEEYAGVLRLLDQTFSSDPSQPEIILRPHPVIPLSRGLRLSGPVGFRFSEDEGTADAALAKADAVLYVSSTMGLEAVRRGIPAVCLDLGGFLDADPLHDLVDLKWTARDPASLRAALKEISGLPAQRLEDLRRGAANYAARYGPPASPQGLEPFYDEKSLAH